MNKKKLFLFGWDAADWKTIHPLMDKGEMPHLQRLVERGTMGNISTLSPVLSPMLWNSIATGKRADRHGILGFSMVDDQTGRITPSLSTARKCKALWNITSQNQLKTNVIGWFAGHPAEPVNGVNVTEMLANNVPRSPGAEWPVPPDTVHPASLQDRIADWRLRPEELNAEILRLFIPRAAEINQKKDRKLDACARLLAEAFSTHSATIEVMDEHEWDFMAAYYISIDHFDHGFMHLHPPKLDYVNQNDFDLYQDVVNSAYRLHDLFLGRILESLDEDTTILLVSDHGFLSDHERPTGVPQIPAGPAAWHRDHGIFVIAGPGIKQDHRIDGATLLDVAPTVLHALGLPVGRDMEGKVLSDCWEEPQDITFIDSWETITGEDGRHPPDRVADLASRQDELLQHFIDLGYVAPLTGDDDLNIRKTRQEQDWNLARVHLEKGDITRALPLLQAAYHSAAINYREELAMRAAQMPAAPPTPAAPGVAPDRPDIALTLVSCLLELGHAAGAREVLESFLSARGGDPSLPQKTNLRTHLLGGKIDLAEGNPEKALNQFLQARELLGIRAPGIAYELGECYRKMKHPRKAIECYREALEWDGTHLAAATRLSALHSTLRDYEAAAEYALQAININFNHAHGHFLLGRALARIEGEEDRAEIAFKTALRLSPGYWQAHDALSRFYQFRQRHDEARQCAEMAADLRTRQTDMQRRLISENARTRNDFLQCQEKLDEDSERFTPADRIGREFTIVSGLPRSGTSLMMGMLHAGGLPAMTDGKRRANEDNPTGYFEWEAVKRLRNRPGLIEQAHGRAVKVVSPLIHTLPAYHSYKVIFMMRDLEEVARSQKILKQHLGNAKGGEETSIETRIESLRQHRDRVLWNLHHSDRYEVLEINYSDLIADPAGHAAQIAGFLERDLDLEAMAAFVQPGLYRQKSPSVES